MSYQEGPDSTVTHRKRDYRVDDLIAVTKNKKVKQIPVSDLDWILPHTKVNTVRVSQADLNTPIIVVDEGKDRIVLDGAHRLTKAKRLGVQQLPAYILKPDELPKPIR